MHIELDHYARLSTPVHAWDTRHKVLVLSIAALGMSFITDIRVLAACLAVAPALPAAARIPAGYVWRRLRYPVLFVVLMAAMLAFTAGGPVRCRCWGVPVYADGITAGIRIVLRSCTVLVLFLAVLETAPFSRTVAALRALRVPGALVDIIAFTYRFIYQYLEMLRKMRTGLRLRGYTGSLRSQGIRTGAGLAGSMLVRSFEQAEYVCAAMAMRGYTGQLPRQRQFRACPGDYLKSGSVLALLAALEAWQWWMR